MTLVKGRAAHLARLMEGLERSDVPPAELIVVDMDGSYEPRLPSGFPIRIIQLPTPELPLAKARNAAAAAASSEVLLFLDVDCIPLHSLIGTMTDYAPRTYGLICAEVLYLGEGEDMNNWNEVDLLQRALPHPVRHFPAHGLRRETNHGLFWSLVFGISRSAFAALGGFDESFKGYGAEDTDLGFQAKKAELGLFFLGGTGALHQHHDVFDPPLQHFKDIVRNATLFHRKWNFWPMEGWLDCFDQMGLIEWDENAIRILREPTADDIASAKVNHRF